MGFVAFQLASCVRGCPLSACEKPPSRRGSDPPKNVPRRQPCPVTRVVTFLMLHSRDERRSACQSTLQSRPETCSKTPDCAVALPSFPRWCPALKASKSSGSGPHAPRCVGGVRPGRAARYRSEERHGRRSCCQSARLPNIAVARGGETGAGVVLTMRLQPRVDAALVVGSRRPDPSEEKPPGGR